MTNFQRGYGWLYNLLNQYQCVLTTIEIGYEIMTNKLHGMQF